jgi:competence protein ComEC
MPRGLYLGDLGASAQRALAASGRLAPPYDLVKVAHHGSADQDPALYEGLGASLALIGVGAGNDYGHPRHEILAVLTGEATRILRTDVDGLTVVRCTGSGFEIWRERSGAVGASSRAPPGTAPKRDVEPRD